MSSLQQEDRHPSFRRNNESTTRSGYSGFKSGWPTDRGDKMKLDLLVFVLYIAGSLFFLAGSALSLYLKLR